MSTDADEAGEMLRTRGMRSTPQRRAILSVFAGGRTEHLAADEVYARASRLVPELSRGTVYATLAEFSEMGLLAAFGAPEPVRYEINMIRCIYCGYCQEACPTGAIELKDQYELAEDNRAALIYTIQDVLLLLRAPGFYLDIFVGALIVLAVILNQAVQGRTEA